MAYLRGLWGSMDGSRGGYSVTPTRVGCHLRVRPRGCLILTSGRADLGGLEDPLWVLHHLSLSGKIRYVDGKFFLTVLVGFSSLSEINRRFLDYYNLEVTVHINSRLILPVLSL